MKTWSFPQREFVRRISSTIVLAITALVCSTTVAQQSNGFSWPTAATQAAPSGQANEGAVRLASARHQENWVEPADVPPDAAQEAWVAPVSDSLDCGSEVKPILGVDQDMARCNREPRWRQQRFIPWESFAYGEYIGPYRTPHVGEYRLRVNDQLEFVFMLDRTVNGDPYRLNAGDTIQISSASDADLNQTDLRILSDGTISVKLVGRVRAAELTVDQLQELLNEKYVEKGVRVPEIVVQVTESDTALRDLRDAVDARFGSGGQSRIATVTPDGTVQLPLIQSVPAVGLTLNELAREVNARYRARIRGIEITPILSERAPRFVYVLGEVNQPGQVTMTGPTTVMQAISQAGGWKQGANLRSVIIFRRDQDWRLVATRLNMAGALSGERPIPSDEIWLRDSDIVLVPKLAIQRFSELVDLYFTRTIYSVFKVQGFDFIIDNNSTLD
jgi:polysaccharide export outer membrane protein